MDKGSIAGFLLIIIAIVAGIASGGESVLSYVSVSSISIVILGTLGATMMSVRPKVFFAAINNTVLAFKGTPHDMEETIETCIRMADKSRKAGMLALEEEQFDDPFVAKTVDMLVDGYDSETIEAMLNKEIYLTRERNQQSVKVMTTFSEFAPAMGMVGTLIGLVAMLQSMDDPNSIGPSMAIALLTTLYGAIIANGVTTPLAKKLNARSNEELLYQTLVKDAAVKIMQGQSPKATFEFLQTYVESHRRKSTDELKQIISSG